MPEVSDAVCPSAVSGQGFDLYLSLGSNLGDRKKMIDAAVLLLHRLVGPVLSTSRLYSTQPWGFQSKNTFYNIALVLRTGYNPLRCLSMINAIERELGRVRSPEPGYHDRVIDIDIIQYADWVISTPSLKVPHPLALCRDFVLDPMAELAPELVHPQAHLTWRQLAEDFHRASGNAAPANEAGNSIAGGH